MHYIESEQPIDCYSKVNVDLSADQLRVASVYPFKVTGYYAGLIRSSGDSIWQQCVPDIRELDDQMEQADPLAEAQLSPVPGLIHRYPDRVVLLASSRCAVYCRFCMRKRLVGCNDEPGLDADSLEKALSYIAATPAIHDVILSGGDPLMLDDDSLHNILSRLRKISHVRIIRIGTRIPVTLPERITPELCSMFRMFHPLYINTHFNHPAEITPESARACQRLADAGIPLGNQTVLLKGVNDSPEIMAELMTGLLEIRVRPYYIHQMDLIRGASHFRTPIDIGLGIMRALRGHISGMAVPHFVIDLPGGRGKVALLPDQVEREGDLLVLTTYQGERVTYRDIRATQG